VILLAGGVVISSLNDAFLSRFQSGVSAITVRKNEFDANDSSGFIRQQRIFGAIETIVQNPLGVGWSGSGWVHSDFLQIIANMGWIPGLIYFFSFMKLLSKSYRIRHKHHITAREKDIVTVLLMCNVAVCIMFSLNNNYVLTQSGVPMFFLWALLHVYTTKLNRALHARTSLRQLTQHNSATAHI
jgi:hypothetical protein